MADERIDVTLTAQAVHPPHPAVLVLRDLMRHVTEMEAMERRVFGRLHDSHDFAAAALAQARIDVLGPLGMRLERELTVLGDRPGDRP